MGEINMDDAERKENFCGISDDIILHLWAREHCASGTYERHFDDHSDGNPVAYLYGEKSQITLQLEFNPETCQEGNFYFEAQFPEDCPAVNRANVITGLSERIKETSYNFKAEDHQVSISGDFNKDTIKEVKTAISSVDDAVRFLYESGE
jgi:hypothetical protein